MRYHYLYFLPLLTYCATPHQPTAFPPYFPPQPESIYVAKHVYETKELERSDSLTPHQKKRLSDLYTLEYSSSRSETRKVEIREKMDRIKSDISSIEEDVRALSEKNRRSMHRESKPNEEIFDDASVRFRFQEAQTLWNKDANDEALIVLQNLREASVHDAGLLKIEYLTLRILLENGDVPNAEKSLQKIQDIDDCSFEASAASMLLSLHHFGTGNNQLAETLLGNQCDNDKSLVNTNRRAYWRARFTSMSSERIQSFETIKAQGVPDYYGVMARYHLDNELTIPKEASGRLYLQQPISVSREMDRLLSKAEESLRANLKRDTMVYLTRASQILRDNEDSDDVSSMLYVAHLFQAAGNHLEAMRIFNWLPTIAKEESLPWLAHPDLVREMFPTPFKNRVEWLSGIWQVDPDLVYALMRQESAFNPGAISSADARGLMQLMPFLAKFLAKQWHYERYYQPKNLLNAEENLKLAAFHLYQLHNLMPHLALVAASYNAGASRATKWWKRYGKYPLDVFIELIPIQETRNYVKYVIRNYAYYKAVRLGSMKPANQWSLQLPVVPSDIPLENIEMETSKIESPQGNP